MLKDVEGVIFWQQKSLIFTTLMHHVPRGFCMSCCPSGRDMGIPH